MMNSAEQSCDLVAGVAGRLLLVDLDRRYRPPGAPAARRAARRWRSSRAARPPGRWRWFWLPPPGLREHDQLHGLPVGGPAGVLHLGDAGDRAPAGPAARPRAVRRPASAARRTARPRPGSATRLAVPNGAASAAACSLGALAGRNLVLLFWVTLDSEGSSVGGRDRPGHPRHQHQPAEPDAEEPIARKIVSICTCRAYAARVTGLVPRPAQGAGPCAASCPRRQAVYHR